MLLNHGPSLLLRSGILLPIGILTYITISYSVTIFGREFSRLRPLYYTVIFCSCDLVSLSLQGTGGGLASNASENLQDPYLGDDIMLAGLGFQVISTVLFIALTAEYFWRIKTYGQINLTLNKQLLASIGGLGLAMTFILIRSVYRVVELSEGWNGYLIGVQSFFIVLEGLMIALATAMLCACHPATWIKWKNDIECCNWDGSHGETTSTQQQKKTDGNIGASSTSIMR
ncbi:hypothetical protein N7490_007255 [Penicillium lividum]|nr:hypothetical protein N7490_007255 [Penicillium lividum]